MGSPEPARSLGWPRTGGGGGESIFWAWKRRCKYEWRWLCGSSPGWQGEPENHDCGWWPVVSWFKWEGAGERESTWVTGGLRECARFGVGIMRMWEKVTKNHPTPNHHHHQKKKVSDTRGPAKTRELIYDNLDSCMVFLLAFLSNLSIEMKQAYF